MQRYRCLQWKEAPTAAKGGCGLQQEAATLQQEGGANWQLKAAATTAEQTPAAAAAEGTPEAAAAEEASIAAAADETPAAVAARWRGPAAATA